MVLILACAVSYKSWHTSIVLLSFLIVTYFAKSSIYNSLYLKYSKFLEISQNKVNRGTDRSARMSLIRVFLNMEKFYKNMNEAVSGTKGSTRSGSHSRGDREDPKRSINVSGSSLGDLIIGINVCKISFKEQGKPRKFPNRNQTEFVPRGSFTGDQGS